MVPSCQTAAAIPGARGRVWQDSEREGSNCDPKRLGPFAVDGARALNSEESSDIPARVLTTGSASRRSGTRSPIRRECVGG